MEEKLKVFDWQRILFNDEPILLLEVAFRSVVMFIIILVFLRISGKRGIKQLSIFELAILLTLGSVASDPLISLDSALIPSLVSLIIVFSIYRGLTTLISKFKKIEILLEGKPVCLLEDGIINHEIFDKEDLAYDEFFSELRIQQVEHLGQVKKVYRETSAEMSIYLYEESEIKPGLPIWPELYEKTVSTIPEPGLYSCVICGTTLELKASKNLCPNCGKDQWLKSKLS